MKKINTSPISGTQELLPGLQAEFNRLKSAIAEVYHRHGFLSIETPVIDRTEILLAKAGGDTEKQIYRIVKTNEADDTADQALRFDHTVPLARYVVEHAQDLAFPLKVTQIARNFRGERPQWGRFREFYQCDVDVIGRESLPLSYDAEVIATLAEAVQVLPFKKIEIHISNRKILAGLIQIMGLADRQEQIFNVIDHIDKMRPEDFLAALTEAAGQAEGAIAIKNFILDYRGDWHKIVPSLMAEWGKGDRQSQLLSEGVKELAEVLEILDLKLDDALRKKVEVVADLSIIRGLDYYTGTVFETIATDYKEIGSICSGGRYDNLASNYTDQQFPGVGGSIGLTRLFAIIKKFELMEQVNLKPVDCCIVPLSRNEFKAAEELARKLRREGKTIEVISTERKLGDKLNYASKISDKAIVLGEDEVKSGNYEVRELFS